MPPLAYEDFRTKWRDKFDFIDNPDLISYQLFDLSDLFQKIAAIYAFASKHKDTAFQNSIIFQVVESALFYGICIQIRRLADGRQTDELSLYKMAQEIKGNCHAWNRYEFVTWDGTFYYLTEIKKKHNEETSRIIRENRAKGIMASWIPIGVHEEIERRHNQFDTLCGLDTNTSRSNIDIWRQDFAKYLLHILGESAGEVSKFANLNLAHRIHFTPDRKPKFEISLARIEHAIISLWNCFNAIGSIFDGGYSSPDIVHQYDILESLERELVPQCLQEEFNNEIEVVKSRMESATIRFSKEWKLTSRIRPTEASEFLVLKDSAQQF